MSKLQRELLAITESKSECP